MWYRLIDTVSISEHGTGYVNVSCWTLSFRITVSKRSGSLLNLRFIVLTLIELFIFKGYMLNEMNWCWSETTQNFNYVECPDRLVCPKNPVTAFWEAASKKFAQDASGDASVMINGSRDTPFQETGVFGRVELPAINTMKVSKMTILVVHDLNLTVVEKCDGKTITQLKEQVRARSLAVDCINDPEWVLRYLCVNDSTNALCQGLSSAVHLKINHTSQLSLLISSLLLLAVWE